MIKFTFTLEDAEAEQLIGMVNDYAINCKVASTTQPISEAEAVWYQKHAVYVEGIKKKILDGQERV